MDSNQQSTVQEKYIEIKRKIFSNTNEIITCVSNLEKNIENVQNCNDVLHQLKENGVHVENAFQPLDQQIINMNKEKKEFIKQFDLINTQLSDLKNILKKKYNSPDKFGKLSFNK